MITLIIIGLVTSGALLAYVLFTLASMKPTPVTETIESYAVKYFEPPLTQEEIEALNAAKWD